MRLPTFAPKCLLIMIFDYRPRRCTITLRRFVLSCIVLPVMLFGRTGSVHAGLEISLNVDGDVDGTSFLMGDLLAVDGPAMMLEGASIFDQTENIGAVHQKSATTYLLAADGNFKINGVNYKKEDIVEYDTDTGLATMILDGDAGHFNLKSDAVHQLQTS